MEIFKKTETENFKSNKMENFKKTETELRNQVLYAIYGLIPSYCWFDASDIFKKSTKERLKWWEGIITHAKYKDISNNIKEEVTKTINDLENEILKQKNSNTSNKGVCMSNYYDTKRYYSNDFCDI